MKKIISTMILLISVAACVQKTQTVSVNLYLQDCKDKMAHWYNSDTIVLYKLPEDTVERKIIIPSHLGTRMLKIQDLRVSEYRVTFKNIFEQPVSKQINITNKPSQVVYVCIDSLQAYKQNTLVQLQLGDSIIIHYNYLNRFHWTKEKLVLLKTSSGLMAKLYDVNGHTAATEGKRYKPTLPVFLDSKLLNNEQATAFVRFENELDMIKPGGCSTPEQYKVESKYGRIEKVDGSCNWGGFHFLKEVFFDKHQ